MVVVGVSVLIVRARPSLSPAIAAPSALGDATVAELAPVTRSARLPHGTTRVQIALVRDPASVKFYDDPRAYDRMLTAWSEMLEATGAEVRRITPAAAEGDPSQVLAVVASPCLSAPARRAMQAAARRGRGVLFTGMTGVRDGGCREVGYGLIAELLGAARADTVPFLPDQYITVPSGSPLSLDIPPGARVTLKPAPHVAVRHPGRDAYYSDADLNPLPTDVTKMVDGALAHDLTDGRRVVYFGFELTTLADRPWEQAIMALLVRNAVALAAGVSLASPDAWPAGHVAAAVIAQDVEDEFENAARALDTLRTVGVPGTFFVVSDLAKAHESLTQAMATGGEVGTHTENHSRLGGSVELQRTRLATSQRDLTSLVGRPVRGMRPPEERFDQSTLVAWKDAGGSYVFGSNDGRVPSPEIIHVGDGPFVLLSRTVDDDFLTVRRAEILDPQRLASDQLDAFAKVHALGGLYIMSYHSNMLARTQTIAALGIVARALKADTSTWITTAGDAASWWMIRHEMTATVTRDGRGGLTLVVRNGSAVPSPATSVSISLPSGGRAAAATEGGLLPAQSGMARVRIPPLTAGGSHVSSVRLAREARHAR